MDGKRSPATSQPLNAPMVAPNKTDETNTNGNGQPFAASKPAHTLHTANCDPTEISICRLMMTSAMPHATTSVGASRVSNESNGCGWKNAGAKIARPSRTIASAAATESSRKWRFIL